jgi:hypothetical protein
MATYDVSIIEPLAGWGAGYWGQGVWGTSTELTDTQVYGLALNLTITETIAPLETEISNGNWYSDIVETVTADNTLANSLAINVNNFIETVALTDTVTYSIPWGVIDSSSTPVWGAISNTQTPSWGTVSDVQNPNWTQITVP